MRLILAVLLFQGVFSHRFRAEKIANLEINCVGGCVVNTIKGKDIVLKVIAPDSLSGKFGIKKEGDVILCGLTESIKNENNSDSVNMNGIKDITRFFKDIKDSIQVEIGIPERVLIDTLNMNMGVAHADVYLGKYAISSLQLSVGAGNVRVNFKKGNRKKHGTITVNAGVGRIKLFGPENFLADTININSGIASVVLNFNKKPRVRPLNVYLSSAMSSFTMVLPKKVSCSRGEVESVFSLKSLENCNDKNGDIVMNVKGALSSIDVIREDEK